MKRENQEDDDDDDEEDMHLYVYEETKCIYKRRDIVQTRNVVENRVYVWLKQIYSFYKYTKRIWRAEMTTIEMNAGHTHSTHIQERQQQKTERE